MRELSVAADGVAFRYAAQPVLEGASFSLAAGELVIVSGPNGSGKTTLLRLCVGLLKPEAGRITVLGGQPSDRRVRRRIGYAPQGARHATSLPVSVHEVVLAGVSSVGVLPRRLGAREHAMIEEALASVGLSDLASECLFELSGGQQQRAMIARALVSRPELILLDEPTTGIDQPFRPALLEELRRRADQGATVVAVSHDPHEFEGVASRFLVVEQAHVTAQDAPARSGA